MAKALGLVASACGGLDQRFVTELAEPAAARGWDLAITLTPTAAHWLAVAGQLDKLRELSSLDVRSTPRLPWEPRPHPDPEVFLFAPASANSVAKLALGIADNQALTVLGDVLGDPSVSMIVGYQPQRARYIHPGRQNHLAALRAANVRVRRLDSDHAWTGLLDLLPNQDC